MDLSRDLDVAGITLTLTAYEKQRLSKVVDLLITKLADIQVPCDWCGTMFSSTRSTARYCTPACKQEAYRDRKARE